MEKLVLERTMRDERAPFVKSKKELGKKLQDPRGKNRDSMLKEKLEAEEKLDDIKSEYDKRLGNRGEGKTRRNS